MGWFQHVSTCKTSYKSNWTISPRAENSNCFKTKSENTTQPTFLVVWLIFPRVSQVNLSCSPSSASMASPWAASSEAEVCGFLLAWNTLVGMMVRTVPETDHKHKPKIRPVHSGNTFIFGSFFWYPFFSKFPGPIEPPPKLFLCLLDGKPGKFIGQNLHRLARSPASGIAALPPIERAWTRVTKSRTFAASPKKNEE